MITTNNALVPRLACSFSLVACFGLSAFVSADSIQGFTLEEVIVTARKRGAESMQDIGGSIQAIGGESLTEKGASGFSDYMRLVPGLAANNAGGGQAQISMRGVNATRLNHANPNVPSTVGVYIGETPISTSGFNPDAGLFDLDRVEVLRGPQGTLFGASSMSGVLRIIPNEATTDAFSGAVGISGYMTEDGAPSSSVHGVVNLPVSNTFAVRILGYSIVNGGYIDNIYSGEDDYNDENIFGTRISTRWNINDTVAAKTMLIYQNTSAEGRPEEGVSGDPLELTDGFGVFLPVLGESERQFTITDDLQNAKIIDDTFEDEFYLASLQLNADVEDYSITSITSYFDRDIENTLDDNRRTRTFFRAANLNGDGAVNRPLLGDYDPVTLEGAIITGSEPMFNVTENKKFTQELRLASSFEGSVNFVAGLYYERDSRDLRQDSILPGLDAWVNSSNQLDGWLSGGTHGAVEEDAYFVGDFNVDTSQIAAFAEATWEIGNFELTAGGRYYSYEQESFIHWQGWVEFSDDLMDEDTSEDGFNPMLEVVYTPNEDVLLYAKAAQGFRLGGVQQFINQSFCGAELQSFGINEVPTSIESDSLWNYEVGVKSTLFEGSTTVNASTYYIDWEGARTQSFLNCGWIIEYDIADIVSKGVELEVSSQVSEMLRLNFGASYNNSEVSGDAINGSGGALALDGDRAPFSPEWTINAGFDYRRPIAFNDIHWFLRGDISYVSDQVSELGTQQLASIDIPSSIQLNVYTGFEKEGWSVTLFARNLSNERIVTGVDTDRMRPAQYAIGRPRNIGVTVTFEVE